MEQIKTRKNIVILIAVICCFAFSACSGINNSSKKESAEAQKQEREQKEDITTETEEETEETVEPTKSPEASKKEEPSNTPEPLREPVKNELDKEDSDEKPAVIAKSKILDFPYLICQYPELPTGCEITALTMLLNYYGIKADKCDLSDNYLDKGPVGEVDFRIAFEGDPRSESSYGCYSPVIVNTANRYLSSVGSDLQAKDISGTELEDLFPYISEGTPVVVWGTYDCAEGHFSTTWYVDGYEITWFTPEHCRVLIGYDETNVYTADPAYGAVEEYPIELFKARYDSLFQQAVVLEKEK